MTTYLTWKNLAKRYGVPTPWLEKICLKKLRRAIAENDAPFKFMDQAKEEAPPKKFVSPFLRRRLTISNLLQVQA